jgi:hypothetical protein
VRPPIGVPACDTQVSARLRRAGLASRAREAGCVVATGSVVRSTVDSPRDQILPVIGDVWNRMPWSAVADKQFEPVRHAAGQFHKVVKIH